MNEIYKYEVGDTVYLEADPDYVEMYDCDVMTGVIENIRDDGYYEVLCDNGELLTCSADSFIED